MKKFTKSLLVLALLVLAVGGAKAGVQTVVKSFDYTTNPVKQDGADYYTTGYLSILMLAGFQRVQLLLL